MTPERWNQVDKLLQTVLDLAPSQRSAFLDQVCVGDESLRKEVESLIASHESGFLEKPAIETTVALAIPGLSKPIDEDLLIGTSLDRYKVLKLLGKGGMGRVYLAHDTRLGRNVAIKVLPADLTKNEKLLRRFEQEARAASALNHPNILTVYDIGEIDSLHFIATEYVKGETLDRRLSKTRMAPEEALEVAIQVASALAEAHDAGILHRDIKPANIMLRPDGNVKVIDFGIAKLVERQSSSGGDGPFLTMVDTEPGMILGTPHYMSPEQIRGSKLDEQSDIFSLGVVLYEMISGTLPFGGSTLSDVIAAILTAEPKRLSQHVPSVPSDLDELVNKALQKTKESRYRKIKDVLADLRALQWRLELRAASQDQSMALGDFSSRPPTEGRSVKLPVELTSFVGREAEIVVVSKLLLGDTRLVTLTGTGGVGKTRLCLHVAAHVADQFPDGAHFVPLASISDSELVASATAQALGVTETADYPLTARLKAYLSEKQALLMFDNFEQVTAAAPLITELLTACPRLKVLVTSRALLRVRGECEFQVPPLELPDLTHQPSIEALSKCPAVHLFLERARAAHPRFVLTEEDASAVAEICLRLDGLPLAIELAAPRIKILPPQALLARLGSRLDLLTRGSSDLPARQQTMRSTIAWSYDLLDEGEKRLFRYLSVFVGGFPLEAAESVCGEQPERSSVLDRLSSLLENSLLRKKNEDDPRFVMLETIREFASERLAKSRKVESLRRAHALFFLDLVERTEPHLKGIDQGAWLERLEVERGNVRTALSWAKETSDVEMGMRMAGGHGRFWWARGHLSEGRMWLEQFLVAQQDAPVLASVRAKGLYEAGVLAHMQGDYDHARARLEESRALYQELKYKQGVASSLNILGLLAHDQSDNGRAITLLEEGLALNRELGDEQGISFSLGQLGIVAQEQGDYERAMILQEESAAIRARLGDEVGSAAALNNLGLIALDNCDYKRAAKLFDQSLTLSRKGGYKVGVAASLNNLGELSQHEGDYGKAAELFSQSLILFREVGDKRDVAALLNNLGDVARSEGDNERAAKLYGEVLSLLSKSDERSTIAVCLEGLASVACKRNQAGVAATILGVTEGLREAIDNPLPPSRRADYESTVLTARSALEEASFSAAWKRGRAMTLEQCTHFVFESIPELLSAPANGDARSDFFMNPPQGSSKRSG
jgi:predicted ATPase/serine/threonine protein kinase